MANARTDDAEAASCQLKTSPAAADIPTSHSVALQGLSAEPSAAHERATTTSIFDELVPGIYPPGSNL